MKTILHAIHKHSLDYPKKPAVKMLNKGLEVVEEIDYETLWKDISQKAEYLKANFNQGERVLLLLPEGTDFIKMFLACLAANLIAVPSYPPQSRRRQSSRVNLILKDCQPSCIVTNQQTHDLVHDCLPQSELQGVKLLLSDAIFSNECSLDLDIIDSDSIAFLQYTSGSTGNPKGVIITHGNILANEKLIQHCCDHNTDEIIFGWLPLFHDMGLIGNLLQPLFIGGTCILISPIFILQHPIKWLQSISKFKVTTTGGPNFIFDLCVEKITGPLDNISLASLKSLYNGSEPINHNSFEAFYDKFNHLGIEKEVFLPCYGLAEGTLMVSGKHGSDCYKLYKEKSNNVTIVSSGTVGISQNVLIYDNENEKECIEGTTGEICIKGPSTAHGYWDKKHNTNLFIKGYLRTGDLGLILENELYVCGRLKELIILRGKNFYPNDIEHVVQSTSIDLVKGAGSSFGIKRNSQDILIVIQEVKRTSMRKFNPTQLRNEINQNLKFELDITANEIIFVKPATIRKTTSGKLKRNLMKQLFLQNEAALTKQII